MANVINFGCRVNAYETEIIKNNSKNLDSSHFILNSCAVTNEAEKDLLQQIKKIKRENPESKIILTGCAAQISPKKYAHLVECVVGNMEKLEENTFNNIANNSFKAKYEIPDSLRHEDKLFVKSQEEVQSVSIPENLLVGDIMSAKNFKHKEIIDYQGTRAIVQVQNGCNHRCTFCIIPFGRGNSRSIPAGAVVTTIKNLVEKGYKEVVLTGIDLTDYGKDLPLHPTLSHLVSRILKNIPQLPRLRLSSIDVAEVDDDMFKILANEERFMPYFHLSLQSGDDMILKRMKRRHSTSQVIDFCAKAMEVRTNVGIGADIIAGFPTETDEQFHNSVEIIRECNIAFGHIFPFSPKQGTPASKMPQVPVKICKERAKILRNETEKQMDILQYNMRGTKQSVLVERGKKGHCENFVVSDILQSVEVNQIIEIEF